MLKALRWRSSLVGLLWLVVAWTDGLIEIVEEQRCHNYPFRLVCRELDSHIAILEAWYTSTENYQKLPIIEQAQNLKLLTNDSELNDVYIYSSPKNNGVFEAVNVTHGSLFSVNSSFASEMVNDSVTDMAVEQVNDSDCGVPSFARSYASWRDNSKRRKEVSRIYSINLRAPISYRCTGVNHCSFVLSEDYPPSARWPQGAMFIKYACFDDSLSVHYCNRAVSVSVTGPDSEGYIRSPGYPHFYVGDRCSWRLTVHPEQRVRVALVDVSLRSIGPFESDCTDYISIQDSTGDYLLSSCEQVELPYVTTSSSNSVEITVQANSKGAFPKRGVLLHYKSVGCVTLPAPPSSYLVYRNEDVAHYMCNENHVFADTRQRARVIWCYDDNSWNDTVPSCIEATSDSEDKKSLAEVPRTGAEGDSKMAHNEANTLVDIIIPSLLIAALFIGNAFIVLIIYKYRKRKNEDYEDEFNTIPLSINGNGYSAGNAV